MNISKPLLAAALPAVACSSVHAEVVVSLYIGVSKTRSSDLRLRTDDARSNVEFLDVHWRGRPFEDAPYYGLRVSYFPAARPRAGASFDFTHYKMYAETERDVRVTGVWNRIAVDEVAPMGSRVPSFEVSHGVNATSLNVQYRGLSSRLQPHVGGGLVAYLPHAEGVIDTVFANGDYQLAGFGYHLFAGGEYRFTDRLALLVEGKFDAGQLEIDLDPQIQASTHVRTVHGIAGVALHF
jgi:hypothetical protein